MTTTNNRIRNALKTLVDLKDGPRDERYFKTKADAWQEARNALAATEVTSSLRVWDSVEVEDTHPGGVLPCPECNDSGEFCPSCTIIG